MNCRNVYEPMEFKPLGSGAEELTVADSVVTAAALPASATHAMVSVKTNAVHVAFGRDPVTSGAGMLLTVGTVLYMSRYTLGLARWIRATSSSGVVAVEPGTF